MEFLLQWLDELDDLAATALFVWHRAGPAWLVPGLAASILLHFDRIALGVNLQPPFLASCALGCVLVWAVGGLVATAFERRLGAAA